MKNFIFLAGALLCLDVHAVTFKVVGNVKEPVIEEQSVNAEIGESVGSISHRMFTSFQSQIGLDYDGNESGVIRLAGLKNEIEVISDREMKAYGWCYSVNGNAPDVMPDAFLIESEKDAILWFYAYTLYLDGVWLNQCTPVIAIDKK